MFKKPQSCPCADGFYAKVQRKLHKWIFGWSEVSSSTNMIDMREKYFPQIHNFDCWQPQQIWQRFQWEIMEKMRREILPPNSKVPNDPLLDFERNFDRVAVNLNKKLKHSLILHIYRRATTAWHLQLVIIIIFWGLSKFLHPFPEGSRHPSQYQNKRSK